MFIVHFVNNYSIFDHNVNGRYFTLYIQLASVVSILRK